MLRSTWCLLFLLAATVLASPFPPDDRTPQRKRKAHELDFSLGTTEASQPSSSETPSTFLTPTNLENDPGFTTTHDPYSTSIKTIGQTDIPLQALGQAHVLANIISYDGKHKDLVFLVSMAVFNKNYELVKTLFETNSFPDGFPGGIAVDTAAQLDDVDVLKLLFDRPHIFDPKDLVSSAYSKSQQSGSQAVVRYLALNYLKAIPFSALEQPSRPEGSTLQADVEGRARLNIATTIMPLIQPSTQASQLSSSATPSTYLDIKNLENNPGSSDLSMIEPSKRKRDGTELKILYVQRSRDAKEFKERQLLPKRFSFALIGQLSTPQQQSDIARYSNIYSEIGAEIEDIVNWEKLRDEERSQLKNQEQIDDDSRHLVLLTSMAVISKNYGLLNSLFQTSSFPDGFPGRFAVDAAAQLNDVDALKLLFGHPHIFTPTILVKSAFFKSVRSDSLAVVQYLIQNHSQVISTGAVKGAFSTGMSLKNHELVKTLFNDYPGQLNFHGLLKNAVEAKCHKSMHMILEKTPGKIKAGYLLISAASNDDLEAVKILLDHQKSYITSKRIYLRKALKAAVNNQAKNVLQHIMKWGMDRQFLDASTIAEIMAGHLLISAASNDDLETVKTLLDHERIIAEAKHIKEALKEAVKKQAKNVLEHVMKWGMDKKILDASTIIEALEIAIESNFDFAVEVLLTNYTDYEELLNAALQIVSYSRRYKSMRIILQGLPHEFSLKKVEADAKARNDLMTIVILNESRNVYVIEREVEDRR